MLNLLLFAIFTLTVAQEVTERVAFPNQVENDNRGGGGSAWTSLTAITGQEANNDRNQRANAPTCTTCDSQYLYMTGFDFKLIKESKILGIKLDIARVVANTGTIQEKEIRLVHDGKFIGENKAGKSNNVKDTRWPPTSGNEVQFQYGSDSDTWMLDDQMLTPEMVNSDSFGAAIKISIAGGCTANLDFVFIAVRFQLPTKTFPPTPMPMTVVGQTNAPTPATTLAPGATAAPTPLFTGRILQQTPAPNDDTPIIIGAAVGAVVCCCILVLLAVLYSKRGNNDDDEYYDDQRSTSVVNPSYGNQTGDAALQEFPEPPSGGVGANSTPGYQSARHDTLSSNQQYASSQPGYAAETQEFGRPGNAGGGFNQHGDPNAGYQYGNSSAANNQYASATSPQANNQYGNALDNTPMQYQGGIDINAQAQYNQAPVGGNFGR